MLEVSYVIFLTANRAEEERPWAIIMFMEPDLPKEDDDKEAAINIPICLTEE